jgi:hypothetical protein
MFKPFFGSIPSLRPQRVAKHVFQEMDDGDFMAVNKLHLPGIVVVCTTDPGVWIVEEIMMLANVLVNSPLCPISNIPPSTLFFKTSKARTKL